MRRNSFQGKKSSKHRVKRKQTNKDKVVRGGVEEGVRSGMKTQVFCFYLDVECLVRGLWKRKSYRLAGKMPGNWNVLKPYMIKL